TTDNSDTHHQQQLILVIVAGSLGFVVVVLTVLCCRMRKAAAMASVDLNALDPPVQEGPAMETVLARYQLAGKLRGKKLVGNGTHCAVFRAHYNEVEVALKTPLACILKRADCAERMHVFMDEICLCARLQHPHIVTFVGVVYKSVRDVTLVTEFMQLGNLATVLAADETNTKFKWLSAKKAPVTKLTWAIGIAEALAYMHGLQLTHRGLKAKNVLLSTTFSPKLGDMGLTRDKEVELSLSNTHSRTAGNIAPELLAHATDYSFAADMYAFGALLCELDTCKPPFSNLEGGAGGGLDNKQIALLVGQGKMQPKFSYSCPDPILDLATQCMDFRPTKRPNAVKIVQELKLIKASLT
ncbi:hypothetical protein DYB25_013676, partial [Aphanomyces astaci]